MTRQLKWATNAKHLVAALTLSGAALLGFGATACGGTSSEPVPEPSPTGVEPQTTLTKVDPQDIALIFPLTKAPRDVDAMLAGTSRGAFGALVPRAAFDKLPGPLDARSPGPASTQGEPARAGIKVVAARIDPCFAIPGGGAPCVPQLRLVFQGIHVANGTVGADDGAVHVFYELPQDRLVYLVKQVLTLREREGNYLPAPLGVHPIMERQGPSGAFAMGLKNILLQHAGESRVTRVTFFLRTNSRQSQWIFGQLDKVGGDYQRALIPTTTGDEQTFSGINAEGFSFSKPTPATTHTDDLTLLLNTAEAMKADANARQRAFEAALRIDNPAKHSPDTIDCTSCHVATTLAEDARTRWRLTDSAQAEYTPKAPFGGPAPRSIENLHAMSYLGRELGLTQRTANETAVSVAAVNELLRTK
jgi:hypothetical protein